MQIATLGEPVVVVIGHCHVLWVPPNVHNPDQRAMNELKSESRVTAVNEKLKFNVFREQRSNLGPDQRVQSNKQNIKILITCTCSASQGGEGRAADVF